MAKNFRYSAIFSLLIIIFHFFQNRIDKLFNTLIGIDILNYIILGFLIPFFIIIFIKVLYQKSDEKIATILLIIGIVFYFFIVKSQIQLITKLTLFEFFILGIILSLENTKIRSTLPLILIILVAILSEISVHSSFSISFYLYDIFLKILLGYNGYTATSIGFRKFK